MVDNVTVTQEDREAAKSWLTGDDVEPNEVTLNNILSLTLAFARHRIDSIARLSPAPEGVDAREFVKGEPVTFDPADPGHDPDYQLQLLGNGICRAYALLTGPDGDRTMKMPEWVLREWNGRATLIAQALSRPPAEQVRMREALEEAAGVLRELIEPDMSVKATSIYLRAKAAESKARAALTPPPKGQNDHG